MVSFYSSKCVLLEKNVFHGFTKQRMLSQEMCISIFLVGSLYVTGGNVGEGFSQLSQVDVVDVRSGETSRGPSMRQPRSRHAAAASPTSLFAFGGDGTWNSCEVFNAQTRE